MIIKLDFDICKGGRVAGKKIIGMRYNYKDIYSLIGNYNAYTIEVTESGYKTVNFDISDEYYYSAIDPYFDMGNGTKVYENIVSYTYTKPGTYQIITSARIDRTIGPSPDVIAINGVRRDTISLENAFEKYCYVKEFAPQNLKTSRVTSMKNMFRNCWHNPNKILEDTGYTSVHYFLIDSNKWDTSNVTDMSGMFASPQLPSYYSCTFAPSPTFNTSNVTNMSSMFENYDCDYDIDFSNWDTSKVTDMSRMFYGCRDIDETDLSNFNTGNVITFKDMFRDSSLRWKNYRYDENNKVVGVPLDFSSWKTSKATDMSGMFYGCNLLEELDLSNWDVSNIIDMNDMFYGCNKLKTLNLSGWNISSAININQLFSGCDDLTTLNMSNWNTSKITSMNSVFQYCNKLTSLNVSGWDTSNVKDMQGMFRGCYNLAELDLSDWDTSNVTDMSFMFDGCNFSFLDISKFNTSNVTDMNSMFSYWDSLVELDLSHFDTSKVTNMFAMFQYCNKLTSLNLSGWDTSNVKDMQGMFNSCESLTELDVNNFDVSNVETAACMFQGCTSLKKIDLSNWDDTSNMISIGSLFRNCSSLEEVDLSNFNTANLELHIISGSPNATYDRFSGTVEMFKGCDALRIIRLDNCDRDTIADIINSYYTLLPTGTINGETRGYIHCKESNIIDSNGNRLTPPDGWEFIPV